MQESLAGRPKLDAGHSSDRQAGESLHVNHCQTMRSATSPVRPDVDRFDPAPRRVALANGPGPSVGHIVQPGGIGAAGTPRRSCGLQAGKALRAALPVWMSSPSRM